MQHYHRNRHRMFWLVLGPLALLLLAAALISRPKWPTMDALPGVPEKPLPSPQR